MTIRLWWVVFCLACAEITGPVPPRPAALVYCGYDAEPCEEVEPWVPPSCPPPLVVWTWQENLADGTQASGWFCGPEPWW